MTTAEWVALTAQVVAALGAAGAALAAWGATRQVARTRDNESRLSQEAALQAIHSEIGQLFIAAKTNKMDEAMRALLSLRARLEVVRMPLPKTIGLTLVPLADLDPKVHSHEPLAEIQAAIREVWMRGRKAKDIHTVSPEMPHAPVELQGPPDG